MQRNSSTHALVQSLLDRRKSVGKTYFSAFILQHKNGKLASERASEWVREREIVKREWKTEYIVCVCVYVCFAYL